MPFGSRLSFLVPDLVPGVPSARLPRRAAGGPPGSAVPGRPGSDPADAAPGGAPAAAAGPAGRRPGLAGKGSSFSLSSVRREIRAAPFPFVSPCSASLSCWRDGSVDGAVGSGSDPLKPLRKAIPSRHWAQQNKNPTLPCTTSTRR